MDSRMRRLSLPTESQEVDGEWTHMLLVRHELVSPLV